MIIIHFLVSAIANPLGITLFCVVAGLALARRCPKLGKGLFWCGVVLALLMGWNPISDMLAWCLEKDYPATRAEALPPADAIVLLGGGIQGVPEGSRDPYPNLMDGADRAWHAARIWKCHPQLKIYCTCPDVSRSTPPFLRDLGVPADCIVALDGPRNTEEEARRYAQELGTNRVYLVTSATHMRRSVRIFARYAPGLEVVPAATDHMLVDDPNGPNWRYWVPGVVGLTRFNTVLHEYLGLVRYW